MIIDAVPNDYVMVDDHISFVSLIPKIHSR